MLAHTQKLRENFPKSRFHGKVNAERKEEKYI